MTDNGSMRTEDQNAQICEVPRDSDGPREVVLAWRDVED